MNHQSLSSFIWSVADLLRGDYKQSEYGRVILPFTVLRRLDCVLADTKEAALAEFAVRAKAKRNPAPLSAARDPARLLHHLQARHEAADGRSGPHRREPGCLYRGLLARGARHLRALRLHAPQSALRRGVEEAALVLFKRDMGSFLRAYAFLSQISDYGITDIEKRAIFFRRLLPLLEFGRERETVDLSKVKLTHYSLRDRGKRDIGIGDDAGEYKLKPVTETGSGEVQDAESTLLDEIIQAVNDLFDGALTDDDKLVYVNDVLKTKLLESGILVQQAVGNTKEQFANSPNLEEELTNVGRRIANRKQGPAEKGG